MVDVVDTADNEYDNECVNEWMERRIQLAKLVSGMRLDGNTEKLRVLVVADNRGGLGDIILAVKLAWVLKKLYACYIGIAWSNSKDKTDRTKPIVDEWADALGIDFVRNCERYARYNYDCDNKHFPLFDVYLFAAVDLIETPARFQFNGSDAMNVFCASEYNHATVDFKLGVGKDHLGIMMVPPLHNVPLDELQKFVGCTKTQRFAVAYVGTEDEVQMNHHCVEAFMAVLRDTYRGAEVCVLVPKEEYNKLQAKWVDRVNNAPTLDGITIAPLPPLTHSQMVALMKYSIPEILVTGDQSISDVICCTTTNKIIYYQQLSHKNKFGAELFKELLHRGGNGDDFAYRYLGNSNGGDWTVLKRADVNTQDIQHVRDNWNFEKRGRAKLDDMMRVALALHNMKYENGRGVPASAMEYVSFFGRDDCVESVLRRNVKRFTTLSNYRK